MKFGNVYWSATPSSTQKNTISSDWKQKGLPRKQQKMTALGQFQSSTTHKNKIWHWIFQSAAVITKFQQLHMFHFTPYSLYHLDETHYLLSVRGVICITFFPTVVVLTHYDSSTVKRTTENEQKSTTFLLCR